MIVALRSALYIGWLFVTAASWAVVVLSASVFVRGLPLYRMCAAWCTFAIWGARVICGVRWRVSGMDNLPPASDRDAAVVLVSKHQSTWETCAYPMLMPHPLAFVFKRELLLIPFFGWGLSRLDMIRIDRSRRTEAWSRVLAQGRQLMARGTWVIMFPEGTRIARGQVGDYKRGAAKLAISSKVDLVPIAVTSARCWPRRSFVLVPGVIDISIGPPIRTQGRRADELMTEAREWIEAEMRRLDPQAYAADSGSPAAAGAGATASGS